MSRKMQSLSSETKKAVGGAGCHGLIRTYVLHLLNLRCWLHVQWYESAFWGRWLVEIISGRVLECTALRAIGEDEITKGLWEEKRKKNWALGHFKEVKKKKKRWEQVKGDWEKATSQLGGKPGGYNGLKVHQMEYVKWVILRAYTKSTR